MSSSCVSAVLSSFLFFFALHAGAASPNVVISQVYCGGGSSGATFTNDLVELFNPTAVPLDLTGWALQYASASGTSWNNQRANRRRRPWFDLACSMTGSHNDAAVAHTNDFKACVITPNTGFQFDETCTASVVKDGVHDQDTDDGAPNTDALFANVPWSFTVVSEGEPAPYTASVHLAMGNQTNAASDLAEPNNYLMPKPACGLSYNRDDGRPSWVSWHLGSSWYGSLSRYDTFRPDPAVPPEWYRVQGFDFSLTGFVRGHMCPNADRDNENRMPINRLRRSGHGRHGGGERGVGRRHGFDCRLRRGSVQRLARIRGRWRLRPRDHGRGRRRWRRLAEVRVRHRRRH